jgi:hypothetical protein
MPACNICIYNVNNYVTHILNMNIKMKSDSSFCGVRLSKKELDHLETTAKRLQGTKSEAIRHIINQSLDAQNRATSEYKLGLNELCEKLQEIYTLNRFIASLLSGLTRRSAKSDPGEAEKMIQAAKMEAVAHREGKTK